MTMDADKCISALVVDLADMSCFEATAYDLTEKGCWIASDKVDLLKEEVGLRLAGFDKLVRGTVIAYGDQQAQISFQIEHQEQGDKRGEIRRQVWITAIVCGKTNPVTMKCRIVDASRSGCRLEGDRLDRLPDDIEVSIPGLDLPISARIVWRKNNEAGIKLSWPFEPAPKPKPEDVLERMKEEDAKPKRKAKKKISAFGG
ncbi:PilZ domain-containing protein [Roseibium aggregatum]|jgi:hypothetical protein|uniref:PilZ domain-containing protein n=1 Tax=Roseibium aggregatum TaxID=187304 RepID=UPI003A96B6C8